MATKVKRVKVWRAEVENKPGVLAKALEPLAGENLDMVVGYHVRGDKEQAVIDVMPVSGRKATAAAKKAGFKPLATPMIAVQGSNRRGVGFVVADALGEAGINIEWLTAQVAGKKFSAVFGFRSAAEAKQGAKVIRKAATRKPKAVRTKAK